MGTAAIPGVVHYSRCGVGIGHENDLPRGGDVGVPRAEGRLPATILPRRGVAGVPCRSDTGGFARYRCIDPDRLRHVDQHYIRADTMAAANTVLVNARANLPLAQLEYRPGC
ncbi:Tn3 family transposase [Nocardia beijingensis]|nr:Tn3 family transposase [Nocardia beijingensis]